MSFIPNTPPTPNWLYNGEMKKINESELKVVLLVTRKTLGWFDPTTRERKAQDYISQSKFMEFTGQSNRAIATAIQVCVEHGWIIAKDRNGNTCNTPEKRARRKVWYQLGMVFTNKISGVHFVELMPIFTMREEGIVTDNTLRIIKFLNVSAVLEGIILFWVNPINGRLLKKVRLVSEPKFMEFIF